MIRNRELKNDLADLNHRLEMIQTVLLVSNPDSPMAAEAYDGLRKTLLGSLKATQVLEAALAQLDQICRATDDMNDIRIKLRELMGVAKVEIVEDYDRYPEAFDVIGSGPAQTLAKPAYIAPERGAVVARGVLELSAAAPSEPPASLPAEKDNAIPADTAAGDNGAPSAEGPGTPASDPALQRDAGGDGMNTTPQGAQK